MSTDNPSLTERRVAGAAPQEEPGAGEASEITAHEDTPGRRRSRRSQAERREQIARATYELVGQFGVRDTSVALIADAVGVTPQALYAHFNSRYEMLVAALDCYYQQAKMPDENFSAPNILEAIRQLLYRHVETKVTDVTSFASPHFEFVVAPRDTDLPTLFGEVQAKVVGNVAALIEKGQLQGSIRQDLDPMIAAWRTFAFAWTEEIALLIGRTEYVDKGYSRNFADFICDDMAPRPGAE
jgi:AcrR family transcriptional regulator